MKRKSVAVSTIEEQHSDEQCGTPTERSRAAIDLDGTPGDLVPALLRAIGKLTLALEAHSARTWADVCQDVATEEERIELLLYSDYLAAEALGRVGFSLWPDPTLGPDGQQEAQSRVDRIIHEWRVETA